MDQYNKKDLYIRFHHADISNLSDGTLRKLLREFSKLTHQILLDEIDLILAEVDLSYSQKQSLRDIVKKEIVGEANFYVEEIEKGSLTVIALLTGVHINSLQKAFGKSVEKKRKDVDENQDVDKKMLGAFRLILNYIKKRPKTIIKKLIPGLNRKILGNRFQIDEIKEDKDKSRTLVNIEVKTIDETIAKKENEKIDNDYLEGKMREEIKKLEEKINKRKKKKK